MFLFVLFFILTETVGILCGVLDGDRTKVWGFYIGGLRLDAIKYHGDTGGKLGGILVAMWNIVLGFKVGFHLQKYTSS